MRKLTFSLITLLSFALVISYCCKKSDQQGQKKTDPNQAVIDKVNAWFDNQVAHATPGDSTSISYLKNNLDFSTVRFDSLPGGRQLIIVPIKKEFKSRNNPGKDLVNNLVLIKRDTGIYRANIVEYIPADPSLNSTVPAYTFSAIFSSRAITCDGTFDFLSISDNLQYEYVYQQGRMQSYGKVQKKPKDNGRGQDASCWNVYLVLTYSDGSPQQWNYLYSYCDDGPCQGTRMIVNNKSYKVDCGGGGGDGSTGDTEDPCPVTDPDTNVDVESESTPQGYDCGIEGKNPAGDTTKTCTYTWRFSNNHLLTYVWYYSSIETCVEKKVNGVWQFFSVTHTGMSPDGTIPPFVDFTCTISSANGSTDYASHAEMDLLYTTTFKINCCLWCNPSNSFQASHATWPVQ